MTSEDSRNLLRCHGTMLCSARHMLMTFVTRPLIHCQLQHRENRGPVVHKANCLILPIEKKLYCKHTVSSISSINTSTPTYNILQTTQLAFSFGTTERRCHQVRNLPLVWRSPHFFQRVGTGKSGKISKPKRNHIPVPN